MPKRPQSHDQQISNLIEQITENGEKVQWFGGADDKAVAGLEKALGVKLPPSYVAFLKKFGGGGGCLPEISGIAANKPFKKRRHDYPASVYHDTLHLRENLGGPNHHVVVWALEEWDYWCLDTSKPGNDGECPVVSGGGKRKWKKAHDTFHEFLVMYLELFRDDLLG